MSPFKVLKSSSLVSKVRISNQAVMWNVWFSEHYNMSKIDVTAGRLIMDRFSINIYNLIKACLHESPGSMITNLEDGLMVDLDVILALPSYFECCRKQVVITCPEGCVVDEKDLDQNNRDYMHDEFTKPTMNMHFKRSLAREHFQEYVSNTVYFTKGDVSCKDLDSHLLNPIWMRTGDSESLRSRVSLDVLGRIMRVYFGDKSTSSDNHRLMMLFKKGQTDYPRADVSSCQIDNDNCFLIL